MIHYFAEMYFGYKLCNISTQNTLITSNTNHPPHSLFYDINEDLSFFLAYAMNKNEEKILIISHQTRIFFLNAKTRT